MQLIKHIKLLEKNIIEDKKKINSLIDLLLYLENDDPKVVLKCMRSIQRTFLFLIPTNSLEYNKTSLTCKQDFSTETNYFSWIKERYEDTVQYLCDKISHEVFSVANLSLDVLMQFIKAEATDKNKTSLNNVLIYKIVECLIVLPHSGQIENLILKFSEYLKFDDIRFSSMKCIRKLIHDEKNAINLDLLFILLKNLHSPKKLKTDGAIVTDSKITRNFFALTENAKEYLNFEKDQQKCFSDIWITFIKKNHTSDRNKLILGCLADKVMPFMSTPLVLADILTHAYDTGGSISLLALNSIFILINDYNLQYPDFYGKLYRILQPNVLSEKYRPRFFYLLDLFLSSTHLPAYLVCAFIKRLSRLSLRCPTPAVTTINAMVINLLVRHPNCQFLIHRPANDSNLEFDPYLEEELDPSNCNAVRSSLWELKTLQQHFHHGVAIDMRWLNEQLPTQQVQTSDLFELSYDEMIVKERKKKIKTVHTNHITAEQFTTLFDDQIISFC